jgi:hypothetical protein
VEGEYAEVWDEVELKQLTDAAHRAIGRYVVTFSQLIYEMRRMAGDALTSDRKAAELAFGQATAQQIADSFFGMCRYRGGLDSGELNIANQLQTEVGEKVTERNKIMHGDWWVGGELGGVRKMLELARLVRVYPNRRTGDFQRIEYYSIGDLDTISDRVVVLRLLVSRFGGCALALSMRRADNTESSPGEYRVSDILVAESVPSSGKGGSVVHAGTRAKELYVGGPFG